MQRDFDPDPNESGALDNCAPDTETPIGVTDALLHLNFDWQSHRFDAVLNRGDEQNCDLTVTSDLGLMPFTAEGLQKRVNIFAILRAAQASYPIRIDITKSQRLKLTASTALPNPVTTRAAIAGVTALLVQARPYLDMIHMLQPNSNSVRSRD